MIVVGLTLALWSVSGAMQTVMWADQRRVRAPRTPRVRPARLIALAMIVCWSIAVALVFGLLILGPFVSGWIGSGAGQPTAVSWAWWTAQWPILIVGLLAAFATILGSHQTYSPGAGRSSRPAPHGVAIWLVASGGFAIYADGFSPTTRRGAPSPPRS